METPPIYHNSTNLSGPDLTAAYICLDSLAGCELIEQHQYKNWQPIAPDQWLYYAGYDEPVKVSADWYWGNVIFRYTLND